MATLAGDAAPTRRTFLKLALILGGLSAFGPLTIDMYLPALPRLGADLHSSDTATQLTLTAFLAGLGLGQLIIGPLSDSLGRRGPLLAGLGIYITASVLAAMAPTVEILIVLRALQAIGAAAGAVISRAAVRDLFSGTAMTKFFSAMMLVNGMAPILAPVVGGQLLRFTSWRGVFVVLSVFGVTLFLASLFAFTEPLPQERRRPARFAETLRAFAALLRDRVFLGYVLTLGCGSGAMFAYISGSSFALQNIYGLSAQTFGLVFGANALGIVACGQINGRIVTRFGERTLLTAGTCAQLTGGIALIIAAVGDLGLPVILPALFCVVASLGFIMPNSTSLALAEHRRSAGTASALLGLLQFLIGAAVSPLVGLGGGSSIVPLATVVVVMCALATGSFTVLTRAARRPGPDTAAAQSG